MKKLIVLFLVSIFVFSSCTQQNFVDIKYRDDDVDISTFEKLNTASSSWIYGAWYDEENEYMVINLEGVYYHYCEMPEDKWEDFEVADSFGDYYSESIRGKYDCRLNYVPSY